MERDEVYVPKTRSDLGLPHTANHEIDWDDYFGDTPIYTMYMLLRQQFLAFPAYLCKSAVASLGLGRANTPNSSQRLRTKRLSCLDEPFRSYVDSRSSFMQRSLIQVIQPTPFCSPRVSAAE